MNSRHTVAVASWVLSICVSAVALQAVPAIAADEDGEPSLIARLRWLKFEIHGGRIAALPGDPRRSFNMSMRRSVGSLGESASIRVADGRAEFQYELTSPTERVDVTTTGRYGFSLTVTPNEESEAASVKYWQSRQGPVRLTIDDAEYEAADLWQLMLERFEDCQAHLAPRLEHLQPDLDLAAQRDVIGAALLRKAKLAITPNRTLWRELVAGLGAEQYRDRLQAERALLAQGPAVLSFLRTLPRDALDAEQRHRVDRVIASFQGDGPDRPSLVALTLYDRPQVWLALMKSDNVESRRLSASYLSTLTGLEIDFNPAADEVVRAKQLEKLRETFAEL